MSADARGTASQGFMIGLFAGTAIGAGLALLYDPRGASQVGDLTRKGHAVRGDVADAAAHGALEGESLATEASADHVHDADRS